MTSPSTPTSLPCPHPQRQGGSGESYEGWHQCQTLRLVKTITGLPANARYLLGVSQLSVERQRALTLQTPEPEPEPG